MTTEELRIRITGDATDVNSKFASLRSGVDSLRSSFSQAGASVQSMFRGIGDGASAVTTRVNALSAAVQRAKASAGQVGSTVGQGGGQFLQGLAGGVPVVGAFAGGFTAQAVASALSQAKNFASESFDIYVKAERQEIAFESAVKRTGVALADARGEVARLGDEFAITASKAEGAYGAAIKAANKLGTPDEGGRLLRATNAILISNGGTPDEAPALLRDISLNRSRAFAKLTGENADAVYRQYAGQFDLRASDLTAKQKTRALYDELERLGEQPDRQESVERYQREPGTRFQGLYARAENSQVATQRYIFDKVDRFAGAVSPYLNPGGEEKKAAEEQRKFWVDTFNKINQAVVTFKQNLIEVAGARLSKGLRQEQDVLPYQAAYDQARYADDPIKTLQLKYEADLRKIREEDFRSQAIDQFGEETGKEVIKRRTYRDRRTGIDVAYAPQLSDTAAQQTQLATQATQETVNRAIRDIGRQFDEQNAAYQTKFLASLSPIAGLINQQRADRLKLNRESEKTGSSGELQDRLSDAQISQRRAQSTELAGAAVGVAGNIAALRQRQEEIKPKLELSYAKGFYGQTTTDYDLKEKFGTSPQFRIQQAFTYGKQLQEDLKSSLSDVFTPEEKSDIAGRFARGYEVQALGKENPADFTSQQRSEYGQILAQTIKDQVKAYTESLAEMKKLNKTAGEQLGELKNISGDQKKVREKVAPDGPQPEEKPTIIKIEDSVPGTTARFAENGSSGYRSAVQQGFDYLFNL